MVSKKSRSRAGSVKFVRHRSLHADKVCNKSFPKLTGNIKTKLASRSHSKLKPRPLSLNSYGPKRDLIAETKAKHRQSSSSIPMEQLSKRRHIDGQESSLAQTQATKSEASLDPSNQEKISGKSMYKSPDTHSSTSFVALSKPQAAFKNPSSSSASLLAAKKSNLSVDSDDGIEVHGNVTLKNASTNNYATLDLSPVVSGRPIKFSPISKKHRLPRRLHLHLRTGAESERKASASSSIQNSISNSSWFSSDPNGPVDESTIGAEKSFPSPISASGAQQSLHPSATKRKSNGLISSLINSLSFRSQPESNDHIDSPVSSLADLPKSDELLTPVHSQQNSDVLASPSAESVSFKPVKKSLVSTLGQGGLTLESIMADKSPSLHEKQDGVFNDYVESPKSDGIVQSLDEDTISEDSMLSSSGARVSGQFKRQQNRNYRSVTESKPGNPMSIKMGHLNSGINGSLSKAFQKPCMSIKNPLHGVRGRSKTVSAGEKIKNDSDSQFGADTSAPMVKRPSEMTIDEDSELTKYNSSNKDESSVSLQYPKKTVDMASRLGLKFANEKRQSYFHGLFTEIPDNEPLFEDYSCALRKDILVQGRLFISSKHMAFYSNIIGLVTHICVPWNKVLSIQKKKTVGIPNALQFSTLHDKYSFASFMSRDSTYKFIYKIWTNGTSKPLAGSMDTLDINLDPEVESQDDDSDLNEPDEENTEDGEMLNFVEGAKVKNADQTRKLSKSKNGNAGEEIGDLAHDEGYDTDSSVSDPENMVSDMADSENDLEKNKKGFNGLTLSGPRHHSPTSTGYTAESNELPISEGNVINAPVGVVFELLFGDDVTFTKDVLKAQGNIDISDVPKFTDGTRTYTFIKPLNGPIGPKQTKCHITERIEKKDFDTCIIVSQTSETPDVPSGNSFQIRTRSFLSWGSNDTTILSVYASVVWTGKSWIKSAVEKGSVSGQKQSVAVLLQELRKKVQGTGKEKSKRKSTSTKKRVAEKQILEVVKPLEAGPKPVASSGFMSWIPGLSTILEVKFDLKTVLIIVLFVILLFGRSRPTTQLGYSIDNLTGDVQYSGFPLTSSFQVNGVGSRRFLQSEADLWDWIDERHKKVSLQDQINDSTGEHSPVSLKHGKIQPSAPSDKRFDGSLDSVEQIGSKLKSQELESIVEMMEKRLEILKQQAQIAQDRESADAI